MFKKIFIFSLLSLSLNSQAGIFNLINSKNKQLNHYSLINKSPNSNQEWTDFSGNWVGTCIETEDGVNEEYETSMTIKQNNDYFDASFISTIIGHKKIETDVGSDGSTSTFTASLNWNYNKSKLFLNATISSNDSYSVNNNISLSSATIKGAFEIINQQLHYSSNAIKHKSVEDKTYHITSSCKYTKEQD